MRANEHGRVLVVDAAEDISANSLFKIILDPPNPTDPEIELYASDGVAVATDDLLIDGEPVLDSEGNPIYLANTYLTYTTKPCDIPYSGRWRIRIYVEFDSGAEGYYGDWVDLLVDE